MLVILSKHVSVIQPARGALDEFGWRCVAISSLKKTLDTTTAYLPAAILIDGRSFDLRTVVAAVRNLTAPANGTPLLAIGAADNTSVPGIAGNLLTPLQPEPFLALLAEWSGPLGDHALRSAPFSPRYRLIRLVGLASADGMFTRFRDELEAFIAGSGNSPDAAGAHRLAGVAGMLGYADLSRLWSDAERGGAEELARAVTASRTALGIG